MTTDPYDYLRQAAAARPVDPRVAKYQVPYDNAQARSAYDTIRSAGMGGARPTNPNPYANAPYQGPGINPDGSFASWHPLAGGNAPKPKPDKPKKKGRKKKNRRKMMGNATRDVNLMLNAQIDAINREQQQAYYDYLNRVNGVNAAYGGFNNTVSGMAAPYQQQTADVMAALNQALAPYQSSQGNVLGLDPNEYTSGQASFNTAAGAAQGGLASMGQRGIDYLTGAQTEGALTQRYAQDNLLQGWEDSQNQFAQRRLDATDHAGEMILQRLDFLRQQALQNRGLRQQYQSADAFNQMMQQLIGSLV